MLDSDTKKRIDDLRAILVGKVPDPKSQVEQITTALIYKFMHDMDEQSLAMGGVPSFFAGEYAKYSWRKLFEPTLGGEARVKLYSEAIEAIYTNPEAPPIFREIFKSAFLPFKDPSTLNMFLRSIDAFEYSHSEKLGDAYEYLLSFMGSQGDAGQFRTPRHIIDFIVALIDPQKHETILDPSCGTAGFLISSYKHILAQNSAGRDRLTAAEKKRLGDNLVGYDIAPDMARIALVNMYLHRFVSPQIHEYDTLSSDARWSEYYDVILANPPFFSPKGGIKPHTRFSISSTRAEVLFVDYIMTHLKPHGRAGIIVPEGITFKKDNAHKSLRKKLVKDWLVGVISLPAGVFKPYAGVKTSILILDGIQSSRSDSIFFAQVDNDGFELGDKRAPIDEDDLPEVLATFQKKDMLSDYEKAEHFISRQTILDSADMTLKPAHYREEESYHSKFPIVPITETFETINPHAKIKARDFLESGRIPIVDQSAKLIAGYWNKSEDRVQTSGPVIVFGDHTRAVKFIDFDFVAGADGTKILSPKPNIVAKFLYYILQSIELPDLGYSRHFKELKEKKIPLPSLEVQCELVDELESYQHIIDGCRQVVDSYKPIFDIDPTWPMVSLGDIAHISAGNPAPQESSKFEGGTFPFVRTADVGVIGVGTIFDSKDKLNSDGMQGLRVFEKGSILFPKSGASTLLNHRVKLGIEACVSSHLAVIKANSKFALDSFLFYFLSHVDSADLVDNPSYPSLNLSKIKTIQVPLPSMEVQCEIVSDLEVIDSIVEGNKKLIDIYEQKIRSRISKIWGA